MMMIKMQNEERENNGYCFIRGSVTPEQILSAIHNIPYELLPPTIKRVEDFLTEIGIKPSNSRPPELDKIYGDLKASADKMEELYKKNNMEWLFAGTIPFIKKYSKCSYGQEPIEMAKHVNFHDLYLGLEDGMYSFSHQLRYIENLLNDTGKELLKKTYRDDHSAITVLASDLYQNKREIFDTDEEKKILEELDIIYDTLGYEARNEEWSKVKEKVSTLQNDKADNLRKGIHKYWLENWYDEYAWDFDEKERESLKNPYK